MAPLARRGNTRFDADDVSDPQRLLRALNEFALDVAGRDNEIQGLTRVAVLPDITLEFGATYDIGAAPFPVHVKAPFSVAGAWIVFAEDVRLGDAGVGTTGAVPWIRPTTGDSAEGGTGFDILYISGLAASRKWKVRMAVAGVKNG